jgi:hypothetical protein
MLDLLAFDVLASLRNIPKKYNIIIHLWTNCFNHLLENLQGSFLSSQIAYEYPHIDTFTLNLKIIYCRPTIRTCGSKASGCEERTTIKPMK